jgi:hypothetical protein
VCATPRFYSKYSPAGLEALHAARNSGRWNGGAEGGGKVERQLSSAAGRASSPEAAAGVIGGGGGSGSGRRNTRPASASRERRRSSSSLAESAARDGSNLTGRRSGGEGDGDGGRRIVYEKSSRRSLPRAAGSPSDGENAGVSPTRLEIGRGGLREVPRQSSSGLSVTSTSSAGGRLSRPSSAPLRKGGGKGGGANRPVGRGSGRGSATFHSSLFTALCFVCIPSVVTVHVQNLTPYPSARRLDPLTARPGPRTLDRMEPSANPPRCRTSPRR